MRFAAVDVGTNSIHLVVVEIDPYVGSTHTVLKAREMVRLGGGDALIRERLGKKAIARGAEVIAQFIDEARRVGAGEVRIAATSAVRDARNREEFQAAVAEKTGLAVEILSGREEARLIHLGVSRGYPLDDRLACIVDIGGGSTEFIVADHHHTYFLKSLPLGSLRLFERFRKNDAVDTAALERHLDELLAPVCRELRNGDSLPGSQPISTVIGTSGTWLGLAALDAAARGTTFTRSHGASLELSRLEELQRRMTSMTVEERRAMPGMNPRRSDIIVAGSAVAIAVLRGLRISRADVCDRALREGLVADFVQRNHDRVQSFGDMRLRRIDSVRALARRLGAETLHEQHVAQLALSLFDTFPGDEPFETGDRDLLYAAAMIHDAGRAINGSAHHKHGAYIVRNGELEGWRPRDRELLAQIVRYHRKAMPKPAHADFMTLDVAERRKIERLAAILRIADGLDARHLGRVIEARFSGGAAARYIEIEAEGEIEAELAAARAKADLYTRITGAGVAFRVVEPLQENAKGEAYAVS